MHVREPVDVTEDGDGDVVKDTVSDALVLWLLEAVGVPLCERVVGVGVPLNFEQEAVVTDGLLEGLRYPDRVPVMVSVNVAEKVDGDVDGERVKDWVSERDNKVGVGVAEVGVAVYGVPVGVEVKEE